MACVSKESCDYMLSNGITVVIMIGGASESLYAHRHQNKIILEKRKGFIRLALQHGANLVPVFSFGENEVFSQVPNPPGSLLRKFQNAFQSIAGFCLPIWTGRGIFTYNFGIFPYRQKLVTVVGKPIFVKKKDNFTEEDVDELQHIYIKSLFDLYNKYKDKYGNGSELEIIQ